MKTMMTNKLLVLGALALVGCGSVEGTYTLDKAETKKGMEAEIAKMPAAEQEMQKMGLGMIDGMDATMELKSGGAASMKMTMTGMMGKDAKPNEETGTWKKEGDDITISSNGRDTKCSKSGKKLTCTETSGKSKMAMVFAKS
jgi:hypothetical protein